MTHRIDLEALTVVYTDADGEDFDLNTQGEPCTSLDDLREFVRELHRQGAFNAETRDALLASAVALIPATIDELRARLQAGEDWHLWLYTGPRVSDGGEICSVRLDEDGDPVRFSTVDYRPVLVRDSDLRPPVADWPPSLRRGRAE